MKSVQWFCSTTLVTIAAFLCGCGAPEADTAEARGAIIGGTATTGDPAVVLLVSYPPDHSTFDSCTASVIAKDVLLTAAHCLDPVTHPNYSFGVFTGPDASAFETANTLIPQLEPATLAIMHPDYDPKAPFTADIGVVLLKDVLAIEPLPLQREPLDKTIEGQAARIVGYGRTNYQKYNAVRHEATTVVAALDMGDTITVGDLQRRSCIGDSGGPALVMVDGIERIVGVDSYTDLAGCLEPAHYRRADLYTAFLDQYAPPEAGAGGAGGGGEGGAGGTGGASNSEPVQSSDGCSFITGAASSNETWLIAALGVVVTTLRRRRSFPKTL
jgi:hypothetical protein